MHDFTLVALEGAFGSGVAASVDLLRAAALGPTYGVPEKLHAAFFIPTLGVPLLLCTHLMLFALLLRGARVGAPAAGIGYDR